MKLLLLSNSRAVDGAYLTHALDLIKTAASGRSRALFLPFASVTQSWDTATQTVQQALATTGLELIGAHTLDARVADEDELIVVGGGNTFQLLKESRERGWLASLHASVQAGAPYVGWSAGANLACPTIGTSNDMPIVDPKGFDALGLVGFQINPHYTNALPAGHRGETRDQRLAEYLTTNPKTHVVALPEGDWLNADNGRVTFGGPHTGYLMRHGAAPISLKHGDAIRLG
jgi:dipeptidase E